MYITIIIIVTLTIFHNNWWVLNAIISRNPSSQKSHGHVSYDWKEFLCFLTLNIYMSPSSQKSQIRFRKQNSLFVNHMNVTFVTIYLEDYSLRALVHFRWLNKWNCHIRKFATCQDRDVTCVRRGSQLYGTLVGTPRDQKIKPQCLLFISSVSDFMSWQFTWRVKTFFTTIALKWYFFSVNSVIYYQTIWMPEIFVTIITCNEFSSMWNFF